MLMAALFLLALASLIDGIVYMVRRPEAWPPRRTVEVYEGEGVPFE